MLAILNGVRGGTLKLLRGTDAVINGVLMNDDGSELDITGMTITIELYAKKDRSDTPTSLAGALSAQPAAGTFTVTIGDSTLPVATFSAADYYAWVKRDDSGDIELSKESTVFRLG